MPITPYIAQTDTRAAIDWYRRAFDAQVLVEPMTSPDGRVGHAEISVHGARVMMSDEHPELWVQAPALDRGAAATLVLDVDDCNHAVEAAEAAGAVVDRRPGDTGHGRIAVLRDPFGFRWMLNGPEVG
ncbi:VOC family protein [Aestuariimicrobium ganziense]|uniref:VOC family protein n=1 Tax=Aestuariimicrobium ganziense TaxID=2773677 RepID=UPI001944B902|nr:VOC family protein [Aestuariimicrobium ganziense]